jgi:preprotein translocase subunit SecA
MYDKLAGMTGTAETEAEEFSKIYGLEVVVVPTNRDMIRDDFADLVFRDQKGKWNAVIDEIAEEHERGRPVLVGTISVAISEMLSDLLKRRGIKHNVLNAKFHEREAEIVAQAGRSGAVTIATNMAGRGTDILLGGNPEMLAAEILHRQGTNVLEATPEQYQAALAEADQVCAEDRDKVLAAGGLHIVGTERHEARRIDNQLRGRAGRQGDPGSSRFYLSLEDDLMRRFASDRVSSIMGRLGFDEEVALESRMVSRTIEGAQTRVEGYNFDARKHVVQYDDVINRQRETIYHERERILRSHDLASTILAMLDEELREQVLQHTAGDPSEWNRAGLKATLTAMVPTLPEGSLREIDEARDPAELTEQLLDAVAEAYEAKRAEAGEEGIGVLERIVLLRVIDGLWVEHLTAVDDMRRGIGLRAYSQRDPLNEFKVEAYRMFDELKATIRHDVTHTVFRVSLTRDTQAQQQRQPRRVTEGRIDLDTGTVAADASPAGSDGNGRGPARVGAAASNAGGAAAPSANRAGGKIGRNDPCWCGSGKKYKRCHGA